MNLVIVESPAKAKTILQYLDSSQKYEVLASFGHVRQLPSKPGSVDIEQNFDMKYINIVKSKKHIDQIISAAKRAKKISIASDPDREGEAIAKSIHDILIEKKINKDIIKRATFNEITKQAVRDAIENPRDLDFNLIEAQESRVCLDYLVGYNLSPVLWKKLPGSRSAGRVQSVALRLIVEREAEIKKFTPKEYWSIACLCCKEKNSEKNLDKAKEEININIYQVDKNKFSTDFPASKEEAQSIEDRIRKVNTFKVIAKTSKDFKQRPYPPFITSTLQQEASKKLGFTSKKTMQIAQKLYEGIPIGKETKGLITYMRTDSVRLSSAAISSIRNYIKNEFGDDFLPKSVVQYKSKDKNAQEAHEAIRPTDINLSPNGISQYLEKDFLKLYQLIWTRTVASQMSDAIQKRESIDFKINSNEEIFAKINGSRIIFNGFLQVYNTKDNIEKDSNDLDDDDSILPDLKENDIITVSEVFKKDHFTSPPPRFTEASLIKNLEEIGIGRPSTYATIISVLQDRKYVVIEKRQFIPQSLGIGVSYFLSLFFTQYVAYDFTAKIEEELDEIAEGKIKRVAFLNKFWKPFNAKLQQAMELKFETILDGLSNFVMPFFFKKEDSRNCNVCQNGKIVIRIGRFGLFFSCSNYPECKNIISLNSFDQNNDNASDGQDDANQEGGQTGSQTGSGQDKTFDKNFEFEEDGFYFKYKVGKFGPYVEKQDLKAKIKVNFSLPKTLKFESLTKEIIIFYTNLPAKIGQKENQDVKVGIGKFGYYLLCNKKYYNFKNKFPHEMTQQDIDNLIK